MMNKIKVMPGQNWKFKAVDETVTIKGIDDTRINITDSIGDDSYFEGGNMFDEFRESLEFVPKTDLEWLAVNLSVWKDNKHLHAHKGKCPASGVNIPVMSEIFGSTFTQWQSKRDELIIDDEIELNNNFRYSEKPTFVRSALNDISKKLMSELSDKIMKTEPLRVGEDINNKAIEKCKEELEKMGGIRLPTEWLEEKGIWTVKGDTYSFRGHEYTNNSPGRYFGEGCTITSFAERENTGKQPVDDWVPVDLYLQSGKVITSNADEIAWNKGETSGYNTDILIKWKPNAEALMKIYLSEQKEKEITDTLELIAQSDKYKKEDLEKLYRLNNFMSTNGLGLPGECCVDAVIRELAEKHDIYIRTNEEKAIAYMGYAYDKSKDMKDVLSEIKKGYVTDVKWVGE